MIEGEEEVRGTSSLIMMTRGTRKWKRRLVCRKEWSAMRIYSEVKFNMKTYIIKWESSIKRKNSSRINTALEEHSSSHQREQLSIRPTKELM